MALLSKSGIGTGNTIQSSHITNIYDALNGSGSYEIVATGSFSGSFAGSITSASFASTASFVTTAQTASYVLSSVSASRSTSSSFATLAATATTASYIITAQTASYVLNSVSASFASTATTASYIVTAQTASYVLNSVSASFATSASRSTSASFSTSSSVSVSSSFAVTASHLLNATADTNIANSNLIISTNATRVLSHAGNSRMIISKSADDSSILELDNSTVGNSRMLYMRSLLNSETDRTVARALTSAADDADDASFDGWVNDHIVEYVSGSGIAPNKLKGWSWSYYNGTGYQDILLISTSNTATLNSKLNITGSLTVGNGITGSVAGYTGVVYTPSIITTGSKQYYSEEFILPTSGSPEGFETQYRSAMSFRIIVSAVAAFNGSGYIYGGGFRRQQITYNAIAFNDIDGNLYISYTSSSIGDTIAICGLEQGSTSNKVKFWVDGRLHDYSDMVNYFTVSQNNAHISIQYNTPITASVFGGLGG